jgi:hypothetical protein
VLNGGRGGSLVLYDNKNDLSIRMSWFSAVVFYVW